MMKMALFQMSTKCVRLASCSNPIQKTLATATVSRKLDFEQQDTIPLFHTDQKMPPSRCLHNLHQKGPLSGYEPWSDEIACDLRGSCMPGSTNCCSNFMFGQVSFNDIAQSSFSSQRSSFHTLRHFLPNMKCSDISRNFSLDTVKFSGKQTVPLWSDDIACILQGTCLPGSTKYCRTSSMFGKLTISDVTQGSQRQPFCSSAPDGQVSLTQRQRLKLAVRDYGSTVVIFHVCISLMSLGGFYLAVSSGLDVQSLLKMLHFGDEVVSSKLATGASTFVVAYGVHKVFAPVRIAITLTCTPFIVRYLRSVGILKLAKSTKP